MKAHLNDIQWSRYNRLFRNGERGGFLYNTLSNMLFELDKPHYTLLKCWQVNSKAIATDDEEFLNLLREKNVIVEPGENERLLLIYQYQHLATCFDTSLLGLTICPTLLCNFRCPYCFEQSQLIGATMSQATMNRLVGFVKDFKDIRSLSIIWYGGEPLLAFDSICALTEQFRNLDLNYEGAGLVTNGYLLDAEKVDRLNDLMISNIQITLDGPREVHDSRRVLAGGGPTFERILENITDLLDSDYSGSCKIRVNVDRYNLKHYISLRESLLEQFKGKNLLVYPGFVFTNLTHSYDHSCILDTGAWSDFTLDLFQREGVIPREGFHPKLSMGSTCVATRHYGFVVGPDGELYKCLEDVGKEQMVIGNIHRNKPVTNLKLIAEYSIGTNPVSNPDCLKCDVLPICGGGCPNKRLKEKQFHEEGLEFCTIYKDHLLRYLKVYYNIFRAKEICTAIISPGMEPANKKGYRIISMMSDTTHRQPNLWNFSQNRKDGGSPPDCVPVKKIPD